MPAAESEATTVEMPRLALQIVTKSHVISEMYPGYQQRQGTDPSKTLGFLGVGDLNCPPAVPLNDDCTPTYPATKIVSARCLSLSYTTNH